MTDKLKKTAQLIGAIADALSKDFTYIEDDLDKLEKVADKKKEEAYEHK